MLCDAGPLVAMVLRNDMHYRATRTFMESCANQQFITTWSCLSEAMYLVGRDEGWHAQTALFEMIERGLLEIHDSRPLELERMQELMARYQDTPMDFADASLISAAEVLDERTIFTFDHHFRIYRFDDRTPVNVVP
jgi:uncharacterized protein